MPRKRVLAEPGEKKRGEKPQDAPLARCRCKREASICERSKAMEERASRSCAPTEPARPVGRAFLPLDEEFALLPGTLAPGNKAISCSWGVGYHFAMRVESLKSFSACMSARRRPVGFAKKSAVESRKSKRSRRKGHEKKTLLHKRTSIVWP